MSFPPFLYNWDAYFTPFRFSLFLPCHSLGLTVSSLPFLCRSVSFSPLLSFPLPWVLCVESTTVEFVLLPLIRLVLIFLPPGCSSMEWINFFNCLSEARLHRSGRPPRGLLPAIYYEIKIDGRRNEILWPAIIETNDDFLLNRIWNVSPTGVPF